MNNLNLNENKIQLNIVSNSDCKVSYNESDFFVLIAHKPTKITIDYLIDTLFIYSLSDEKIYNFEYPFSIGKYSVKIDLLYIIELKERISETYEIDKNLFPQYCSKNEKSNLPISTNRNGKFGFVDKNNDIKNNLKFDFVSEFTGHYACVKQSNKFGYIDMNGDFYIEPSFDYASNFIDDIAHVINNKKSYIIDLEKNLYKTILFDTIKECNNEYIIISNNPKCHVIDREDNIIFECKYNPKGKFSNGLLLVSDGEKFGYLNTKGELAIELKYNDSSDFSENIACVSIENKYGYINKHDEIVIDFQYEYASSFSDGLACVKINNLFGFIDAQNNIVIEPSYSYRSEFKGGYAIVSDKSAFGLINKKGNIIIPFQYDYICKITNDLYCVTKNFDIDIISISGKNVDYNKVNIECVPANFSIVDGLIEKEFYFENGNEYSYHDLFGKRTFKRYDGISSFNEGFAYVRERNYNFKIGYDYYFINKDEIKINEDCYIYANSFSNGLASCTNIKHKIGYINTKGETQIPFKYDYATDFSENLACVAYCSNKYGIINKKGDVIAPIIYDSVSFVGNDCFKVCLNGFFGIINNKGEELITPIYDKIKSYPNSDYYIVSTLHGTLWGVLSKNNTTILPIEFKYINFEFDKCFVVKNNVGYSLYDKLGKEISLGIYDDIIPLENNLFKFNINGYWGIINTDGEIIIKPTYWKIYDFKEGFARVQYLNYDFNFIDINGAEISDVNFIDAKDFNYGIAAVKNKINRFLNVEYDSWEFIDKTGAIIHHYSIDEIISYSEDMICVRCQGTYEFIDKLGKSIKPSFIKPSIFMGHFALIETDLEDEELWDFKLDNFFNSDEFNLENSNYKIEKVLIDKQGNIIQIKHCIEVESDIETQVENNILYNNVYKLQSYSNFINGFALISVNKKLRLMDVNGRFS